MLKYISKYMLYIYTSFIKNDDIEYCYKWSHTIIKSILFVRAIYIWIASIIFFPFFLIGMKIEETEKIILKYNNKLINKIFKQ
jgi:hypothetical protein